MSKNFKNRLKDIRAEASAPCRVDMGGTLDISTFHYPLRHLAPCTFNMAIDLRTRVRVSPYSTGRVKVTSRGFQSAVFPLEHAPFDHPLGLIFAIAAYFRADGICIDIESASPPRSALGGSSSAAVALVALFAEIYGINGRHDFSGAQIAALAQAIEASVAGVPCGLQDQLAAVFGGVNAWHWTCGINGQAFEREKAAAEDQFRFIEQRILVAYCGRPHASKDINGRWVKQFLSGKYRETWANIVELTRWFVAAFQNKDFGKAAEMMNRETELRQKMTPDVLDGMGEALFKTAASHGCGARFTGAGGGGCVWALGRPAHIRTLRKVWDKTLEENQEACLLETRIAAKGVQCALDLK